MRLGRFEALPNSALGDDAWEITVDDAAAEGGKRKIAEAPNRILAESDLLRINARAVLGNDYVDGSLNEGLKQ